jgi:enoyl-[acyl-carrier protein] reductase III
MSIFVTGGTKGIGLEIALAFAEPNADVFLNYHADERAAAAAKAAVVAKGARCHLIRCDVGTPEGAGRSLAMVREKTERLDQLVHCAVRVVAAPVLEIDPVAFTEAITLNGTALLYLVQAARPLLKHGSTVFFLSSRGGRIVLPNYAAVGVAKALGESLVRYLATELALLGIRANCIAPSIVETDAVHQVFGEKTAELMAHARSQNPSGRSVEPKDFTSLIRFLASPEAAFIQGQVIYVNGGHNLMG